MNMDYEDLVRKYSTKYNIPGMDIEDVEQELRALAFGLQPKLDDEKNPRGYINRAMYRWCVHQFRGQSNQKSRPLGSFVSFESLPSDSIPFGEDGNLEVLVEAREKIQHQLDFMETGPRSKVTRLLANIAIDQVLGIEDPIRKQQILEEVAMVMEQENESLPDCHPDSGVDSADVGYDTTDAELCQNCDAKFSCLPTSIAQGLNGLNSDLMEIDPEVAAVERKLISVEQIRDRIAKRNSFLEEKNPVPEHLSVATMRDVLETRDQRQTKVAEDEVAEDEVAEDEVAEDEVAEDEVAEDEVVEDEVVEEVVEEEAPKAAKKTATKKKVIKKKATKKKVIKKKAAKKKAAKKKVVKKKEEPAAPVKKRNAWKKKVTKKKAAKKKAAKKKAAKKKVACEEELVEAPSIVNPIQLEIQGLESRLDQLKLETKELEQKLRGSDPATKASKKKATKKKATKKKATKKKATKKTTTKKKTATKKKGGKFPAPKAPKQRAAKKKGGKFPAPRSLSADEMKRVLEKTNDKFRQNRQNIPFAIAPGMTFEMYRANGETILIEVTENGFLNQGELYGSLSSALTAGLQRLVSSYREFDFNVKRNIAITGENVPGGRWPE